MATLDQPAGSGDHSATVQSFVDAHDDVELQAGGVFNIGASLNIRSGKRLFTDPNNPATLKRTGSLARTTIINGNDIQLRNLTFDWNFGGTWQDFRSHIAFAPPDGSGITPATNLGKILIVGCKFEASNSMGTHGGGDCWCISFSPGDTDQDIDDVKILGCRFVGLPVQLTGNGTLNGTWSNVEIAYNYVSDSRAGAIAISSLATTTLGNETSFEAVNVHHNVIRRARSTCVFVGQDNGNTADGQVNVTGLVVDNNVLEVDIDNSFPGPVLIRAGSASGYTATAQVTDNMLSIIKAQAAGLSPRVLNMTGNTSSTLLFTGNKINGRGDFVVTNATLTQSGNVYLNGDQWSP